MNTDRDCWRILFWFCLQESTVVAECTAGGDAAFANGRVGQWKTPSFILDPHSIPVGAWLMFGVDLVWRQNSDAISEYTKALKAARGKGIEAELLSKRSAVFSRCGYDLWLILRWLLLSHRWMIVYGFVPWSVILVYLEFGTCCLVVLQCTWGDYLLRCRKVMLYMGWTPGPLQN